LGTNCTIEEIDQYDQLFKEFQDIFAWSYDYLKEYEKSTFQHILSLKEGSKPFKKTLRIINPNIKPLVKIELEKLKRACIIFSTRHSKWLSNPMAVRKKSGEIRLCVDFRDLNQTSIKYNYPLPNMEMLLH
jgi:hypothetical protein